ncbi:uncharacterized protein LOC126734611 [Anthonomus grandis grandis]|uniref:uncharacterized protein LOC126734611 n=1 Tax=Anthonomus grandis grandis TaxID=2921223 RepID=UPI002165B652|nr:uncharacterized protein LOC126734611 [Anthonomus grandis grandis]
MGSFKYDIVTLIELVESKPCLWDKHNENNKNKILRDKSWQEVFQCLEDGYDQHSQVEKKKNGELIMHKWSNIRDSLMLSLSLCELKVVKERKETSASIPNVNKKKSNNQKQTQVDIEGNILEQLNKLEKSQESPTQAARKYQHTDQEMLLLSFLPYVRDMNENEMFDLQMEVLQTIRKIKHHRGSLQQACTGTSTV